MGETPGSIATGCRFPVEELRSSFPALVADPFIFFDNAAGAQIPQIALDAVMQHLVERNVQRGGRYSRSRAVDEAIAHARQSVADFVHAKDPSEIAFGMNAISFMRLVSLAISQTLNRRREFIVTELDHESNIASWLALEARGAQIRWWRLREDQALHVEDLEPPLFCVFLDCVHYGPHGQINVQEFGADYLVCSGYKIFAPHMGFLWGRKDALDRLPAFREFFIPDKAPAKFEVGTFVYENVAGMDAAISYLENLGQRLGGNGAGSRQENLNRAMEAIREYEMSLSRELVRVLSKAGAKIYGASAPEKTDQRVPTFCFNLAGITPNRVVESLAEQGIGARDGHMYSPRLMRRLGLKEESGAVRVSLVHYNTIAEIERFGRALEKIAGC